MVCADYLGRDLWTRLFRGARISLLIADEPVSALDVSIQAQIINLTQSPALRELGPEHHVYCPESEFARCRASLRAAPPPATQRHERKARDTRSEHT